MTVLRVIVEDDQLWQALPQETSRAQIASALAAADGELGFIRSGVEAGVPPWIQVLTSVVLHEGPEAAAAQ